MDFSFTEEQTQIKDLTNQILRENCHDEFLMQFGKSGELYSQSLWKLVAEAGLLGTAIPEEHGGTGFGFIELCQMLEEQGRFLAPIPLLPSLVLGGLPLSRFGTAEQQARYLPALAAGEAIITAAIAEASMVESMRPVCKASQENGQWSLTGERLCVPYAAQASVILVAADTANGKAVFLVEPGDNVKTEYVDSTNHEPLYHVQFCNARAEFLGDATALEFIIEHASIAGCATLIGITEEALRRTAEYTSERKQFGTSIASFQNTTMKCADAYIDIECMRSAYLEAMWKLSENIPAKADVHAAKWWAAIGSHRVAHTAQHLHGGIGADVEYPLHRYYLWFKQMEVGMGGGSWQLAQLGATLAADNSINLLPETA
ncbi:MAG TPA: acyl-CoA dehydrogenase family protein [Pseudomonadales bacterium]|nr:acyl-CoA dehydrogenase family protein [Pseudomonadales bacterium]